MCSQRRDCKAPPLRRRARQTGRHWHRGAGLVATTTPDHETGEGEAADRGGGELIWVVIGSLTGVAPSHSPENASCQLGGAGC